MEGANPFAPWRHELPPLGAQSTMAIQQRRKKYDHNSVRNTSFSQIMVALNTSFSQIMVALNGSFSQIMAAPRLSQRSRPAQILASRAGRPCPTSRSGGSALPNQESAERLVQLFT